MGGPCFEWLVSMGTTIPPYYQHGGAYRVRASQMLAIDTAHCYSGVYRLKPQLHFAAGLVSPQSPVSLLNGFPDIMRFICGHSRAIPPMDRDAIADLQ